MYPQVAFPPTIGSPARDNSRHRDPLVVLGVSTAGISSGAPFNERTSADGSDTFTVSDTRVSLSNAAPRDPATGARRRRASTSPTIAIATSVTHGAMGPP